MSVRLREIAVGIKKCFPLHVLSRYDVILGGTERPRFAATRSLFSVLWNYYELESIEHFTYNQDHNL